MYSNHQRVMLPLALMSLLSAASAAVYVLPPPTDVSVSCRNLQTVVTWKYIEQQPASIFRVKVSGSEGHSETVTQERRYDLSHFIWQSADHLLGFHYVNVTAIQGSQESKTVTSQTFTYNDLKTADIKCSLDFPQVDLTVDGVVRFPNPLRSTQYAKLKDVSRFFDFSVTVVGDGVEFNGRCHEHEEMCRLDVRLREGKDQQCVRLRGDVLGSVLFTETQDVCHQQSTDFHVLTLALLLSLLVVVIAVITFCICKVKAWMMKSPPLPKPLVPLRPNTGKRVMDLEKDVVSRAEPIAVNKSYSSITVSSEEEDEPSQRGQNSDRHPPDPAYEGGQLSQGSDQELEAVGLISIQREDAAEDELSDDSQKTDILVLDLEDDEETVSVYDCPHRLDMGDGDMVKCYGGR